MLRTPKQIEEEEAAARKAQRDAEASFLARFAHHVLADVLEHCLHRLRRLRPPSALTPRRRSESACWKAITCTLTNDPSSIALTARGPWLWRVRRRDRAFRRIVAGDPLHVHDHGGLHHNSMFDVSPRPPLHLSFAWWHHRD